jgi:hypothetical protein
MLASGRLKIEHIQIGKYNHDSWVFFAHERYKKAKVTSLFLAPAYMSKMMSKMAQIHRLRACSLARLGERKKGGASLISRQLIFCL